MSTYDGDTFYYIITGVQELKFKEQALSELKAHVKRDFVTLHYVPRYFDALVIAADSPELQPLSSVAFSTICHLVKRVSIQEPIFLQNCYAVVVPCLISRLNDQRPSIKIGATRSLQLYWTHCPTDVELIIRQQGLTSTNSGVKEGCLQFLTLIVEQEQNFMFKPFTARVVSFLKNETMPSIREKAAALLVKFFKNSTSKNAKLDLTTELMKQCIDKTTVHTILMDIDPNLISEFNQLAYAQTSSLTAATEIENLNFVNSGSVKITTSAGVAPGQDARLARPKSSQTLRPRSVQAKAKPVAVLDIGYDEIMSDSSIHSTTTTLHRELNPDLKNILSKINGYQLDHIKPIRIDSVAVLRQEIEELLPAFNGKETEFNWTAREKHTLYLRSLLRGNCCHDYPEELSQSFRLLCDAVTKAVSSLRTSLSSNGCQLVKEMAIFMGDHLDNVTIDVCATTLLKLSSATKKIASQNAMVAFSSLIANVSYHQRMLNQVVGAAHDKNIQPRLYSSTWIQIYIAKNHEALEAVNGGAGLASLIKAIVKCLSDPNATVRESMRSTFWCFYQHWPSIGETYLSKLDHSTKKALDRSKPLYINNNTDSALVRTPKKRQSIRELIVAKNRTTTTTASVPQTNHVPPRLPSTGNSQGDIGKPARVIQPQKAKRVSSFKTSSLAAAGVAMRSRSEDISRAVASKNEESTKDIFSRTTSNTPEAQVRSEGLETTTVNDVSEEDFIIKCLRSQERYSKEQGISLLQIALLNSNEEFPGYLDELLDSLSINDPGLLKPLFVADTLPQSIKHFSPDNFMRSFIICNTDGDYRLKVDINDSLVTTFVDSLTLDALFSICTQLINTSNNVSLVVNGKLTMQFIKFKRPIFNFVNLLLSKILESFPISDVSFKKVSETSFSSVDFFKTAEIEEDTANYVKLLRTLYDIKPQLFRQCLISLGESVLNSVCDLASIKFDGSQAESIEADSDNASDDAATVDGIKISSLYEMTMIRPTSSGSGHVSAQDPTAQYDMTMVMPTFMKQNREVSASSMKENIMEEEEEDDSIFQHEGLNFQKAALKVDKTIEEENADIDMGETKVDGLTSFDKHEVTTIQDQQTEAITRVIETDNRDTHESQDDHSSASSSHELITQIENVNISSPPMPNSSGAAIEDILTKSDPFSAITGDKAIQIYDDANETKNEFVNISPSTDKSAESGDTWYSFELQKYTNVNVKSSITKKYFEALKSHCLAGNSENEEWLTFVVINHQSPDILVSSEELVKFLDTACAVGSDQCMDSLSILLHNLKSSSLLTIDQLESIWNLIIFKLAQSCEYYANEMWFAVSEITHELISHNYKLAMEVATTSSDDDDSSQVLVYLCVIKMLATDYLNDLSIEEIQQLSRFSSKYVNDETVAIRKLVITIFSILSRLDDQDKYLELDQSKADLSLAQCKLIDEYAMLS